MNGCYIQIYVLAVISIWLSSSCFIKKATLGGSLVYFLSCKGSLVENKLRTSVATRSLIPHSILNCVETGNPQQFQQFKNLKGIMHLHRPLSQKIHRGFQSGWAARWRTRWIWAPGTGRGSLDRAGPRFPPRWRPTWMAAWLWWLALKHIVTWVHVWSNTLHKKWRCKKAKPFHHPYGYVRCS